MKSPDVTPENIRRVADLVLGDVPNPLKESILYSLLGPGKRIRPRLVLAVGNALRIDPEVALRLGVALEMTHAFTLIHDDLPAMDNDDFRRGHLTNHKVFGEAVALLAGDALALLGCDVVLSLPNVNSEHRLSAMRVLLEASGARGVIAGQAAESNLKETSGLSDLLEVFRLKTGALFRAALTLPTTCDATLPIEAHASIRARLADLGEAMGIAFQIADDLEDDFAKEKKNPAHMAFYVDRETARRLGTETLETAFSKLSGTDPASLEFRLREEIHPFLEELRKKIG